MTKTHEPEICHTCKKEPSVVTYALGHKRCQPCSDSFDKINRLRRQKEERARKAAHICNETDDSCELCCCHDEHDHGFCLDCGKDLTDSLISSAETAFEDK